ncbi:MAG TPA: AAA family ATPase [Hyphomicrobiales bacterium]|nr:AAA family ATPase [Hyphomicrobiales bacterium]
MYLEFFGMRELPFTLTPNTDFFIDLDGHHQALEVILLALAGGEGFIKITGEVGTGKTLLCRRLLNTLGDDYVTAYIPNPFLTPDGLMLALAEELELPVSIEKGRHHILGQINAHLIKLKQAGKKVVFLLDEAQAMPEESIEALRLLTNLETESEKLLQIVLFGQPELNDLLNRDSLRQLRQRITFTYVLPVLTSEEVASYINHRVARSGFPGINLFSAQAIDAVAEASAGIPRLINILCHKALLVAYGRGETKVTLAHANRAIEDTEDARMLHHYANAGKNGHDNRTLILACLGASAFTLLAAWLLR